MVSTRARKEALDAVCYGFSARQSLGSLNFARREELLKNPASMQTTQDRVEWLVSQIPR
jgi:hypothetical protein